jgi:hypothetical protein
MAYDIEAYLAAAQKAKWVVCSSIVMPLFPTSSKSYGKHGQGDICLRKGCVRRQTMSFHPPGPVNPVIGTTSLIIRLTETHRSDISFLTSCQDRLNRHQQADSRHAPTVAKVGTGPACRILQAPLAHGKVYRFPCRIESIAHRGVMSRELSMVR